MARRWIWKLRRIMRRWLRRISDMISCRTPARVSTASSFSWNEMGGSGIAATADGRTPALRPRCSLHAISNALTPREFCTANFFLFPIRVSRTLPQTFRRLRKFSEHRFKTQRREGRRAAEPQPRRSAPVLGRSKRLSPSGPGISFALHSRTLLRPRTVALRGAGTNPRGLRASS